MRTNRLLWIGYFVLIGIGLRPATGAAADCPRAESYVQQALALGEITTADLLQKERLYQQAIALCPTNAQAHNNLGYVYEKQGRFEEAIAAYQQAQKLQPSAPNPYFGLGDVYFKTGQYADALTWYEKGLQYEPENELTQQLKAQISDLVQGGVVKKATIINLMGILHKTRGRGADVSLTFGEGLIPFDYNKADIRPDAETQLQEIGKALEMLLTGTARGVAGIVPDENVIVLAGHTDSRGADAYNLKLAQQRAEAVINYLVAHFNIPAGRLVPESYGKRRPLCLAENSEACHALNRRVEIISTAAYSGNTGKKSRSGSYGKVGEPELVLEAGFFFRQSGGTQIEVLTDESRLRSRSDTYFLFFRPLQDCYVYILQEDATGKLDLLFPHDPSQAFVRKGQDYWMPEFGKGYTLDDTIGEEKLYLMASSETLIREIAGLSGKDQIQEAMRSLKTRAIYVKPPAAAAQPVAVDTKPPTERLNRLLERIEGHGAWVKVVTFRHE